jgi:hypothetical protein
MRFSVFESHTGAVLRSVVACCVLVTFCVPALRAADDAEKTGDSMNGRWWQTLSADQKFCWLTGFREGAAALWMQAAIERSPSKKQDEETFEQLSRVVGGHFTFLEMAQALDLFFQEPSNRQIQVVVAFAIMKRKFDGGSNHEIDQLIVEARHKAAKLQEVQH